LARAAVESIAYQVADLLDAMQRDCGNPVKELRVDGGAAANDGLMQFQSDILQVPVIRPAVTETTALGAACLAGLAVGFWPAPFTGAAQTNNRRFEPNLQPSEAAQLRARWNDAVSRSRNWETASSGVR
jgi:glycerol kinase